MKKCAVITGAAGGLGKAFAAECATRGWDLILTDVRTELLPPLATGLHRLFNANSICIGCDLTDPGSREKFWGQVKAIGQPIHFLFNVAGNGDEGAFTTRNPQDLCTLIQLNIEATVDMTRRSLNHRDPLEPFHIINISSMAGFFPMPLKAVYAASKRFIIDFSIALSEELKPQGITTTVLCPAGLPTHAASIERIKMQGLFGYLATVNVGNAAALCIDGALAGRKMVIPGFFNRIVHTMGTSIPPGLAVKLVGSRWRKLHHF